MTLYEILSVAPDATAEQIKRAYRDACKAHHPDKHGGDDSAQKKINSAYEALSDPVKRRAYDETGAEDGVDPAIMFLSQIVINMLSGDQVCNPLDAARDHINRENGEMRKKLKQVEKMIARLVDSAPRLKVVGEKPNTIGTALEQSIAAYQHQAEIQRQQIALGERMLKLLKDYTFEMPAEEIFSKSETRFRVPDHATMEFIRSL